MAPAAGDSESGRGDDVDRAIQEARQSGVLSLSSVDLHDLPQEVRELRELRELRVLGCALRTLPTWLGELTSLERVDLARNPLEAVPEALALLPSLRELGLAETQVRELSPVLRELPSLEVLSMSAARVTTLPPWIGELTHLRALDLGGNRLDELPDSFAKLGNLTHLYLWGHGFRSVPSAIGSLGNLEVLDLSNGGTADQGDEARAFRLHSRVPLSSLSRTVGMRQAVRGQISALPGWLSQLLYLRILCIGGQRVRGLLTPLPPQLDELWMGANDLEAIPSAILAQVRLRVLDLHDNRLLSLPPQMYRLQWLRYLDLRGNPLRLPPEVLARVEAPQRIADYSTRAQGPTRPLNEAKLLVVGEGSVGKTSLIRRLVSGEFSIDEPRTKGIEVNRWQLDTGETSTHLNVWDFGGQEIMHATHQFFLTKRSLYVLVVDARQGEEQNRIEYWLKLIHSFGGTSPVIIVGNKTDQSVLDIDERGLKAKYPNVVDILSLSCMEGSGIVELERRLAAAIEQVPHVRDLLPAAYFNVKQELEALDVDFVAYADYERLCRRHGVNDPLAREALVEFLHDLGTVLCFRDDPRLSDTNILNPEWVTGGVYRLLNSHVAAQRKGLLSWSDIDEILDTVDYPPERRAFIVDVMQRFELCYESDRTFLIPDLLTKQEPDTGGWEGALVFEIGYDVLPSSVISRLIVRMRSTISKETVWRTGLVVAMDGNRGLIKGDREDAVIQIAIDGPSNGRRGLLTAIRTELRAIAQTIPGLSTEERVPVPGHSGVFVPYSHLLELEAAGRDTVVPQGLVTDFSIRELLAGVEVPSARITERDGERGVDGRAVAPPSPASDAWTPDQALRLGAALVVAIVLLAAVFVGVDLLVGAAAAAVVTMAALVATLAVATVVLRSSGRLSEQGFLTALRDLLTRVPQPPASR